MSHVLIWQHYIDESETSFDHINPDSSGYIVLLNILIFCKINFYMRNITNNWENWSGKYGNFLTNFILLIVIQGCVCVCVYVYIYIYTFNFSFQFGSQLVIVTASLGDNKQVDW